MNADALTAELSPVEPTVAPPVEERQCPGCGKPKPLTRQFWHRKGDGFHLVCKLCRNDQLAEQRDTERAKRLEVIEVHGIDLAAKIGTGGANNPHTSELLEALMEGFGGVRGFGRAVVKTFWDAKPGSNTRTRIAQSTMSLVAKNSENGGARLDTDLLDDGELEAAIKKRIAYLQSLLAQIPLEGETTPGDLAQGRLTADVPLLEAG